MTAVRSLPSSSWMARHLMNSAKWSKPSSNLGNFPMQSASSSSFRRWIYPWQGKSRGANGKGVRGRLLHGAFSVGLMKFCGAYRRAHPGFLDSQFHCLSHTGIASDAEDAAIASTPLKDRAFRASLPYPANLQLRIILENVDVPDWLAGQPQVTHSTGKLTRLAGLASSPSNSATNQPCTCQVIRARAQIPLAAAAPAVGCVASNWRRHLDSVCPPPYRRPFSPPGEVVTKPGLTGLPVRHSWAKVA